MQTTARDTRTPRPCSRFVADRPGMHTNTLRPRRRCTAAVAAQEAESKVYWYEKRKELFLELKTEEDLERAKAQLPPGKLLAVDFYAGWCAICKAAYPSLIRIAESPALNASYVFAKGSLELPGVEAIIQREGIKGIPWMVIYSRDLKIVGFAATFTNMTKVRSNLERIAAHHSANESYDGDITWVLDDNGLVIKSASSVEESV